MNLRQFVLDLVETIVLAGVLYLAINAMSARVRVDGSSMIPSLQNGEYVLVSIAIGKWWFETTAW